MQLQLGGRVPIGSCILSPLWCFQPSPWGEGGWAVLGQGGWGPPWCPLLWICWCRCPLLAAVGHFLSGFNLFAALSYPPQSTFHTRLLWRLSGPNHYTTVEGVSTAPLVVSKSSPLICWALNGQSTKVRAGIIWRVTLHLIVYHCSLHRGKGSQGRVVALLHCWNDLNWIHCILLSRLNDRCSAANT